VEKRAAAIAMTNMIGNFAQIYSPYLYPKTNGPRYLTAMTANSECEILCHESATTDFIQAIFVFVAICLATLMRFCLVRENAKLAAAETQDAEQDIGQEKDLKQEIVQQEVGGVLVLNPGFRYVL
jgi:hypothetical protein